ncbi:MAG: patatin-like phospholipase family protein [Sulfurovum sp.]|nr:patatin-like phospholipase family protein [Sulfurovum sp.]
MIQTLHEKAFSLVLSGGGALGIAHLGVLHDMEAKGLKPAEIIGTSMGGIIGACLAIGMKEVEIYTQIRNFVKVSNWIKFSFSGNAIVDNDKIAEIFETLFGKRKMKDADIPLKLITTHLKTGEKRVFNQHDDVYIKDAVLATMAIPGVFEEHTIQGEVYGDGFLCENLGVLEASHRHILAVDVLGKHSFEKALPDNFFKTHNVLEMFERSMRLLILNQSRAYLEMLKEKHIVLIEPETKDFSTYQFHKHEAIRAKGLGLL